MKKKFTMLFAALLAVVGVAKADVTDLPQITTDLENPIYYTIKNVKGGVYAAFTGSGAQMKLNAAIENESYLFYFTAGTTQGTYKIHNAATGNLCAGHSSWTEAGAEWTLSAQSTGVSLSLGGVADNSWNNYQGAGKLIAYWGATDGGSAWEFEQFTGEVTDLKENESIQMSTDEEKHFYYIKNRRKNGQFANYVNAGSKFTQTSAATAGSYWYFVDASEDLPAGTEIPEGYVACRVYNAGNALAVENPSSGNMAQNEGVGYPAKIYFVGKHDCTYWDYVIYSYNEPDAGWNDLNGVSVTYYKYDDAGSIWTIEAAGKTEAELIAEAVAAKTNALALIANAEYASYYTYSNEAIATAKTTVNDCTNDNLNNAISGHIAINSAIATLEASEKGTTGPAVGDIIQLKNRKDNKYLKSNAADAENTDNKSDLATFWRVEEGDEGNVLLKNVSTNKYMGQIRQSATVVMQEDVANAAQFSWTNQTGVYAVFKDVTGGGYAYGHVNGGKLVGWTASEAPTQWTVSNVRPLTITYLYNDETLSTATEFVEYGTTYTILSSYDFTKVTACSVNGEALEATEGVFSFLVDAEAEVVVEIAESLPFEAAADVNSINTWYYAKMHTNQPGYLGDIADDNTINVAWGKSSDVANENYVWGFVGNVFDGITVVNKGTGLQLTSTGDGNATLTESGTPFVIVKTSVTTQNARNGFCLRKSDSKNYLNANYNAGKLSHWGLTDEGSTFFLSEYEEDAVTVSDVDWATMYLGYAAYIPEGVNVYAVTGVENSYVTLTQIEGVIPANTGVLLENAGEYTFVKAAKEPDAVAGNLLQGSTTNTYVAGDAYVLAKGSKGVGLYKAELNKDENGAAGTTHFLNNAGKAYLVLPTTEAAPAMFSFSRGDDEDTTAIDDVELTNDNVVIYDLAGRRVAKMEKGIYIVNGKKVIK